VYQLFGKKMGMVISYFLPIFGHVTAILKKCLLNEQQNRSLVRYAKVNDMPCFI
jgi:hypothetical protein